MNNEQYRNLMWHLLYVEGLLENVADANAVGGLMNALFVTQKFAPIFRLERHCVRMRNAQIVNQWSGTVRCGF